MAPSSTAYSTNTTPPPPPPASVPPAPPTASKRRFDEVLATFGGEVVAPANKRAKRDTFDAKSDRDKLASLAKRFVRAVNPFMDIGLVLHYGCIARWGSDPVPAAQRAEAEEHAAAFEKMVQNAGDCVEVIEEFWKNKTEWPRLRKLLRDAASTARQGDTTSLKSKLNYLLADTAKSLINETGSKSNRGRNHPMLRDALCPWPLRLVINQFVDPEDGEEPADIDAEPVRTPEAAAALKALMKGLTTGGKKALTAGQYPSCFYAEDSFDPDDTEKGLFRSPFLIRIARHIWTTPGNAFDDSGKVPKACKARSHGQLTWTSEMIGYITSQARTMISTSDWTTKDQAFNYERMFKSIQALFADETDPWVIDILGFYQRQVFGSLDGAGDDSSNDDDDDDDDSVVSGILARRAARKSSTSSESGTLLQNLSLRWQVSRDFLCIALIVSSQILLGRIEIIILLATPLNAVYRCPCYSAVSFSVPTLYQSLMYRPLLSASYNVMICAAARTWSVCYVKLS
ncbi:hypothetical protein C8R46DRAFT_1226496 [Mycena filopes]|nr:hypothetical protein C8R46DRAFT_1226496 [Mycena filopes]